jgi:hypothetical protein
MFTMEFTYSATLLFCLNAGCEIILCVSNTKQYGVGFVLLILNPLYLFYLADDQENNMVWLLCFSFLVLCICSICSNVLLEWCRSPPLQISQLSATILDLISSFLYVKVRRCSGSESPRLEHRFSQS